MAPTDRTPAGLVGRRPASGVSEFIASHLRAGVRRPKLAAAHPPAWPVDGFGCLHALFGTRFGRFQAPPHGEADDFEALKHALLELVAEREVGENLEWLVLDSEVALPWWQVNSELATLETGHRLWPVGAPSNAVAVVLAPSPGFLAVAKALRIPLSEYGAP